MHFCLRIPEMQLLALMTALARFDRAIIVVANRIGFVQRRSICCPTSTSLA